jgi:lipid-binding SYLF domain-containing protein
MHWLKPGIEVRNMRTIIVSFGVLALLVLPAAGQDKEEERVANAGTVISEIMNIPDNVPQDTIDKADCVVVLPSVLKLAFGIGGSYGRGVMTCRGGETFHGPWSAPTMMALEGGSFGLQLGGQATDFVLLLMSPKSASNILACRFIACQLFPTVYRWPRECWKNKMTFSPRGQRKEPWHRLRLS